MYEAFYRFSKLPFENTPDPRFFYASEQHREALAAIEYTIRLRKGIVLVTGDIGSGKTTVGRTMLQRCGGRATIVQLLHGHQTGGELIRHILRALDVQVEAADDHTRLLERLNRHLLEQNRRGRPVVLFIDEAQTLSDAALEELRLISNFDTDTAKLLQLILVGQPELRDRIASPTMSALRQRVVMAKQLRPMSIHDTAGYIAHRVRAASVDPKAVGVSFAGDAIQTLYQFTRGVPRLVNVVCDNCLLVGYVREARRIEPAMVRQVLDDMVPSFGMDADVQRSLDDVPFKLAG
ncbi:MAG: AAA family ATPase [Planctomycetota bacterium]